MEGPRCTPPRCGLLVPQVTHPWVEPLREGKALLAQAGCSAQLAPPPLGSLASAQGHDPARAKSTVPGVSVTVSLIRDGFLQPRALPVYLCSLGYHLSSQPPREGTGSEGKMWMQLKPHGKPVLALAQTKNMH